MLRFLVFIATAILSVVFIVYNVSNFLVSTNSVKRRLKRDIRELRKMINIYIDGLIPLTLEEIQLLSANPISKIKRRSRYSTASGYLSTIYREPLFAYGLRKYHKTGRTIMLVQSERSEYKYLFNKGHTQLYKDDQLVGHITMDDKLMNTQPSEMARIDVGNSGRYATIYSDDQDLAHLNVRSIEGVEVSERAFSAFHNFDNKDSETLIYLSLYHLLFKPNLNL